VLHLACGLDTRVHRLDPPSSVRWFDVDYPRSSSYVSGCFRNLRGSIVPAVRNAGATLHWGIDDPGEIETWHEGLECLDALRSVDMPGLDKMPASGRLSMWVLAHLPGFRDIGRILRYRF
jgi:O-methyltransferase involved in polyketide biosynthesis